MGLNKLMMENGYLEIIDGVKLPSEMGRAMDITVIEKHSEHGSFTQCLFGPAAVRWIAGMYAELLE
jgi:hypothetical protein